MTRRPGNSGPAADGNSRAGGAGGRGPRNDLTDIPGLSVGSAADETVRTGVTVILPDRPMIVAGEVRAPAHGLAELHHGGLHARVLLRRVQVHERVLLHGLLAQDLGAPEDIQPPQPTGLECN